MNLVNGQILDTAACDAVLETLEERLRHTLEQSRPDPERVISACGMMLAELDENAYLGIMESLGISPAQGRGYLEQARMLFGEKALRARLRTELGPEYPKARTYTPSGSARSVTEQILPLGVLLHVAAGNADGLPAFSVLEGLLTGNINILKLPAADGGLSVRLLMELLRYLPEAAEWVYVFDYSSRDLTHIQTLVQAADAVVVWGGDEAIRALRATVPPQIRLIEWGHKLSFAYATESGATEEALAALAAHIVETKQLLCSSCQGIFLDTDDYEALQRLAKRFLPHLERAARQAGAEIGIVSQSSLRLYAEELEAIYSPREVFRGEGCLCSVTVYPDSSLELSHQFGHPWVRPLPREKLGMLRGYKSHLQTAGLLCAPSEREALARQLLQTGVVRVCAPERMSETYTGAPHDGEYPLRRYTRISAWEE